MADWSKLVHEHQRDVLEEGEQVLSTLLVNPPGSIRNAAIAGGIAGALGSAGAAARLRAGSRRAAAEMESRYDLATLAGRFPVGLMMISVTNRRLLVFDRASARAKRPETLVAVIPREAIVRASSTRRFLRRDFRLEFVDGSVVELEAGVAQPFAEFEQILSKG